LVESARVLQVDSLRCGHVLRAAGPRSIFQLRCSVCSRIALKILCWSSDTDGRIQLQALPEPHHAEVRCQGTHGFIRLGLPVVRADGGPAPEVPLHARTDRSEVEVTD
jgi:hypothetical protein